MKPQGEKGHLGHLDMDEIILKLIFENRVKCLRIWFSGVLL